MVAFKPAHLALQALNYTAFMALVWYLSGNPAYRQLGRDQAMLTLAFGHAAKPVGECIRYTADELAKMAPNMRTPVKCPRERSPLTLRLSLDERVIANDVFEAPGLYNDQSVDVYREFKIPAGRHRLSIWMNDDVNTRGPTYTFERELEMYPAQRLVVGFDARGSGFSAH